MSPDLARYEGVLKRLIAVTEAETSMLAFTKLMMPSPRYPDDPDFSRYEVQRFHEVMCAALEELEAGRIRRLIINLPPRHGKTQLASKMFTAWFSGKNPDKSVIFGTYNEKFSQDIGRAVRDIMLMPPYAQVFPGTTLKTDSKASDRLETTEGGILAFVGRGGTTTGRGGDLLVIDDPIKDRMEADSPTIRDTLWTWFTQVIASRLMDETGRIMLIQCMTGDTPVMMADGVETPLRDIRPGDRVATYDRDTEGITVETVLNWANQGPDKVFTIRTKSGSVVKANARHPFLVDVDGALKWRRTDTLKKGDKILRVTGGNGAENFARKMDAVCPPSVRGSACPITTRNAGQRAFARLRSRTATHVGRTSNTVTVFLKTITMRCLKARAGFALFARHLLVKNPLGIGLEPFALTTVMEPGKLEDCSAIPVTGWLVGQKQQKHSKPPRLTSEVFPDPIVYIEETGVEEVFDIEVNRTKNFIADNLVASNTRWHQDDLIGRLTDPHNSYYDPEEAAEWRIIDLPALAFDDGKDPLRRQVGEPLWPGRFGKTYLQALQRRDVRGFSALYQGRPSPAGGTFFSVDWLHTYRPNDLPSSLRCYAASDHAVALKQGSDKTCLMVVGIDKDDLIWVLPDLIWRQMNAEQTVESMLRMMKAHKPLFWWAERGHISKSIGPFLRKRMLETHTFCSLIEMQPIADKQTRAQSIQGRLSMNRVRFPERAPWWPAARDQMLKFPYDAHDDFVDTLAYIGLGLTLQVGASQPKDPTADRPSENTYAWLKMQREQAERSVKLGYASGGW
jgi:predicted phage terminase large subunit-like protein